MKRLLLVPLALGLAALVLGLSANSVGELNGAQDKQVKKNGKMKDYPTEAICILVPLSKSNVKGVIRFTQKGKEVLINGEVTGLEPGKHGFHVHEFGDLSSNDGMSTGPHFDPEHEPHGGPTSDKRHVGDLGNIVADKNGKAVIKMKDSVISLHGPHSIVGRAIIVHGKADDLKSQPAGDAGPRIGGGVIGIAKARAMSK
jgi:Cu-Zn family superoxide dismutase